jgi:hypothetical protein
MPKQHGADGTYIETTPHNRVLEVFDDVDGPVVLSADVANKLDCSPETARRKLAELYERGKLDRRKVSRRVIYWKPAAANEAYPKRAHDGADTFENADLRGDASTTLADDTAAHGDESDAGDS